MPLINPYTMDDLWDAVQVLNPDQPRSGLEGHYDLAIIISTLIAVRVSKEKHGFPQLTDINANIAFNQLTLAYYHLCTNGYYNLKDLE